MTQIPLPLIRNSERADFKSCPRKWAWNWNAAVVDGITMGLEPAMPKQDARWFGTLWHLLWATVYTPPGKDGFERSITKPEEIHALWDELCKDAYTTISCTKWFGEDDEREFHDAQHLGHVMIAGQLKQWNLDPQYEVLMPEQRFRANILFNKRQRSVSLTSYDGSDLAKLIQQSEHIATAVGTFDLPVRDHADNRDRVWILDWKSTVRRDNLKQANKDDQMGTYIGVGTAVLRALGYLSKTEAIAGAVWSFARKAKPPDNVDDQGRVRNMPQIKHYQNALLLTGRFEESDFKGLKKEDLAKIATQAGLVVWGDVSKNQGAPLFWREAIGRNRHNRLQQMVRLADDAEMIIRARGGMIPITKSPGEHCNWCDFNDLCDLDEDGGDVEEFIKQVFKYRDPYADHREGAKNSKESVRK